MIELQGYNTKYWQSANDDIVEGCINYHIHSHLLCLRIQFILIRRLAAVGWNTAFLVTVVGETALERGNYGTMWW